MVARIQTAAFNGVEVLGVDVQVHLARGVTPGFYIVGLANKAVSESKERVRSALAAIGPPWSRLDAKAIMPKRETLP